MYYLKRIVYNIETIILSILNICIQYLQVCNKISLLFQKVYTYIIQYIKDNN